MIKSIYTDVRDRIATTLSEEIKTVAMFNRQFDNERTEIPFLFPCVFVEFSDISYTTEASAIQKGKIEMTLHVGFHQLIEDLTMFDIQQAVTAKIHGWSAGNVGSWTRVREIQDTAPGNVIDWQIVFNSTFTDTDTYVHTDLISTGGLIELELNTDLDIDELVIRTGDGV